MRQTLGRAPAAIILFAAPHYDHKTLLGALRESCDGCVVVGASSAGEFTNELQGDGLACVLALGNDGAEFRAVVGRGVQADPEGAARQLAAGLTGLSDLRPVNRAALVMTDALAGHADILVDELTLATAGQYRFFGGGAGDNAQFQRTTVFCGDEVLTDAVVALEILSDKPIGVGVSHGWEPASAAFRVTDADGMRLIGLNGLPAVEALQAHAEETGQTLETSAPIPFFLHNILGIETPAGHRLRVPLAVEADGSVLCAAEVPVGSVVRVMRSSHESTVEAAQLATDAALAALGGHRPGAALFFDCVATRLRMGEGFGSEVAAVKARLGGIDLAGCNTHGQIARAEGQFQGFHNCTAVVCVLPE
ncbi:FIST signal transduction protein [Phenylobacterium hankyongense]|uniref:FIST signal transduction protein n=1 Tax=Phenylobacterium hankyongense TaxID=1813876 RepID=UPI001A9E3ACC|nr:FIST N-terminal domain-containing protein [Phenylobacterium hankyongense]